MEKSSYRLPPSENGEWWEIGDESRGGIPYYYHTKTGETVWEKPDGFVIPLTVLQVRPLSLSIHRELKRSPTRILPWAVVSPDRSLQPQPRLRIRRRLHFQRYKSNALRLTVHVQTRKFGPILVPLVGFSLLPVLLPPPQKRTRALPLCDVTLPPILIILPRRAWRRRFLQSPGQRRAPRPPQPLPTAPSSLVDHHLSRCMLQPSA